MLSTPERLHVGAGVKGPATVVGSSENAALPFTSHPCRRGHFGTMRVSVSLLVDVVLVAANPKRHSVCGILALKGRHKPMIGQVTGRSFREGASLINRLFAMGLAIPWIPGTAQT